MNQIKVNLQQSIAALHGLGWPKRKIARELQVDRHTVRRYLAVLASKSPTPPPNPQTGSPGACDSNSPANPQTGSDPVLVSKSPTLPPNPQTGVFSGPGSLCEPWRERIAKALAAGVSVQRIYQDLVEQEGFDASYFSVRRLALRLVQKQGLPFRRIEVEPGQELQVDFGQGAWVLDNGRRRRPHLFRAVLGHSRKGYSEVVWRQTTESFIRCLENAFRSFGGVTKTVVIDNLRAAVSKADWFDPDINPKLEEFCRHYGTVMLPCKPVTPRHKGKVESGVKYGQNNALKGLEFESLGAQNQHLERWESQVADLRIHGTTKRQVRKVFLEVEKPRLLPLPQSLFPVFEEAPRTVHQDGYVELEKACYSVPPEYVGRRVWARWEARLVRLFNLRHEQIALHARVEPGRFATDPAHIHDHKRALIERGSDWLLDRARLIGPHSGTWAGQVFKTRGPIANRVIHGLLALAEKHPVGELEKACRCAIEYGAWRLRDLRSLLSQQPPAQQLTFLEKHPLIRDLETYDNLVPVCFATQNPSNTHKTHE